MRLFFILCFISTAFLWGCSHSEKQPSRTEIAAKLITEEKYQEAFDLIASYKDTLKDDKERHLEMLQWVMVNDKLFHPIRHDSLVKKLLHYYIDGDNERELHPWVFYYTGRTYMELLKNHLALKYLYKVIETADQERDWDLLSRTHSQIGSIFIVSDLFSLAKKHFLTEYDIEISHGDLQSANDTKTYIALAYRRLGQPDSALILYKEMMEAPYFTESKENKELVISQYLAFLIENKQFTEAEKLLKDNHIVRDSISYPPLLHTLNNLELREGKEESVKERSFALLTSEGIHRQRQAADNLSQIFLDEGNLKEALKYTRLLRTLSDSIVKMEASAYLSEMAAIHDVSEKEHENSLLKKENLLKTKRNYLLWGLIVTLLLIMAVSALVIVSWRSRVNLAHKKALLEAADALQGKLSEINRYQKEIAELKSQNAIMAQKNLMMVNEGRSRNISLAEEKKEKSLALSTAFCDILKKIPSSLVTEEDFLKVEKAIMDWDPDGMMRLKQLDLSPRFFKDALLIIGNVPPKVCATILKVTPQAISTGRTRAFKNMAADSQASDWCSFIKSFFTAGNPD